MDEQIDKLVDKLGISIEEAKQLIADDKAIDQGADLFPQTAEQKKVSKKMTITGTRKTTVYDFKNRQRKPDEEKEDICLKAAVEGFRECYPPEQPKRIAAEQRLKERQGE